MWDTTERDNGDTDTRVATTAAAYKLLAAINAVRKSESCLDSVWSLKLYNA